MTCETIPANHVGSEFQRRARVAPFCSHLCQGAKSRIAKPTWQCRYCKKDFQVPYKRSGVPLFCQPARCKGLGERAIAAGFEHWESRETAIAEYVMTSFLEDQYVPTREDIMAQFQVSGKTLTLHKFSLFQMVKDLGIDWKYPSKFQGKVRKVLYGMFGKYAVRGEEVLRTWYLQILAISFA